MGKLSPEQIEVIWEMHAFGVPLARIARRMNITDGTVRYWVYPEKYARMLEGWATLGLYAEDHDRIRSEAKRRRIPVCHLIHELVERGLPRAHLEAAE